MVRPRARRPPRRGRSGRARSPPDDRRRPAGPDRAGARDHRGAVRRSRKARGPRGRAEPGQSSSVLASTARGTPATAWCSTCWPVPGRSPMPSSTATSRSRPDTTVAAMLAAVDILIDVATRVPALRELAEGYVAAHATHRRPPGQHARRTAWPPRFRRPAGGPAPRRAGSAPSTVIIYARSSGSAAAGRSDHGCGDTATLRLEDLRAHRSRDGRRHS